MKKVTVHALKDIHTVLTNKRKVGGAIEAKSIRLRSGEEFHYPVFTSLEQTRGVYQSIGFMTSDGERLIVNIDEIAMMKDLEHKLICQLENSHAKTYLLTDTLNYLQRLCEVNEGCLSSPFKREVEGLACDIGAKHLEEHGYSDFVMLADTEQKIVSINQKSMLA
ncbi:hypothetical protein [Alkalicoccobacillus plakortidis]|uniref:Uncharacterized protein n=1 Tax=Alkalicoccobacillus plakortidis TaxID=444060 RepID=A0ABT0XMA8_9BACI|nr:hypothetical protein [Alkalicoccobacillus plakortidis]MCM2677044.1 hypothetical protein [Alkalicoccobacillus plakortidis]